MKTILKEGIAVNCRTEEEAKELLAILDKDGYVWSSGRSLKKTKWDYREKTCYGLYLPCIQGEVVYGLMGDFGGYKIISFSDWKKSLQPTISEHLIRSNKTIIKLSNGKVGTANCLPANKFNVGVGAVIAVAKAYGVDLKEVVKLTEKKEPTKADTFTDKNGRKYHVVKQEKYEVGDKVKIVDLEELKNSFCCNPDGFMDKWADKIMTIEKICDGYFRTREDRKDEHGSWAWYPDMIAGKVIYDEPELFYAKDIVGKWAVNTEFLDKNKKYKILYTTDKSVLVQREEGGEYCFTLKDAFGETWQLV